MGAGDDSVSVMLTGTNGTPAFGSANITKLDGGAGTDTLSFGESYSSSWINTYTNNSKCY